MTRASECIYSENIFLEYVLYFLLLDSCNNLFYICIFLYLCWVTNTFPMYAGRAWACISSAVFTQVIRQRVQEFLHVILCARWLPFSLFLWQVFDIVDAMYSARESLGSLGNKSLKSPLCDTSYGAVDL